MDTTCGSYALKGAKAREDAQTIKDFLKAGMIILAKTNPSVSLIPDLQATMIATNPSCRNGEILKRL